MSAFSAAAARRAVSADTDASNSEARADADEAAADAEARAEAMADDAEDASADGSGWDENDPVLGGVGLGLTVEPPPPLLPHPVSTPAARANVTVAEAHEKYCLCGRTR
ncbi:hypothetical protein ACWCRF_19310 [Streptomyces sp. NPDC002405]|uniref:hypothetical protein n=1 Tax=unclassified Streptomyces TaxID=2593676 RepID=UPI0036D0F031